MTTFHPTLSAACFSQALVPRVLAKSKCCIRTALELRGHKANTWFVEDVRLLLLGRSLALAGLRISFPRFAVQAELGNERLEVGVQALKLVGHLGHGRFEEPMAHPGPEEVVAHRASCAEHPSAASAVRE